MSKTKDFSFRDSRDEIKKKYHVHIFDIVDGSLKLELTEAEFYQFNLSYFIENGYLITVIKEL